jgi:hypothetical protein
MRPCGLALWSGISLFTILLVSRFLIVIYPPPLSDARMHYGSFALEFELASHKGQTIYQYEAQRVKNELARPGGAGRQPAYRQFRITGGRTEGLEDGASVEYPPLALFVMRLPLFFTNYSLRQNIDDYMNKYLAVFRAAMVGVDVILIAALVALLGRLFPQEGSVPQAERLLVYLISTLALWPVLYDRLDLIQAMMVQLALLTLQIRVHFGWSLALLALAINFKIMPVVLAPVFLIGSMPAATNLDFSPTTARALGARALVLIVMVIALFLPFYLSYGVDCLRFVGFHRQRGLEINSLYSSLLLGLQELGYPVEVYYSHYCINVRSDISGWLLAFAPYLTAVLLFAATLLCWNRFQALARSETGFVAPAATLAQLHPREAASYSLLFLLLCQVSNKVFSPQYMLWLAPLVPLVSMRPLARRTFMWIFVLSSVLTTILFPYLFLTDLVPQLEDERLGTPTHRALILLGIRNLLIVGLTLCLALQLWRHGSPRGERSALH